MDILKNNKGISLASVLVTVIIMLIVLSSIIYSNSQTNEIKKAMLLNNDIEELTKKVEVYYLEKETLPMIEDEKYRYWEDTNKNGEIDENEPVYYKLEISLLENLTLNNNEIINENEQDGPQNGDQWYVINKETHTIYFVKHENGQVVLQEAKYSSNYHTIINEAKSKISFNVTSENEKEALGKTEVNGAEEGVITDNTGGTSDIKNGQTGTNGNPGETSGSGIAHYTYANYIGWNSDGTSATNLVLQYDGEYNVGTTGNYHDYSATTWKDLTGNGYDGKIVTNDNWELSYYETGTSTQKNYLTSDGMYIRKISDRKTGDKAKWTNNCITLAGNNYVVCDGYKYDGSYKTTTSGTTYNNYISGDKLNKIPSRKF